MSTAYSDAVNSETVKSSYQECFFYSKHRNKSFDGGHFQWVHGTKTPKKPPFVDNKTSLDGVVTDIPVDTLSKETLA